MSKETKIQWCDSTINPSMGCDGCEIWNAKRKSCYAGILHDRYGNVPGFAPRFEQVTQFPGRMAKAAKWADLSGKDRTSNPWLNGLPRMIFVSDMSDALSQSIPFDFLHDEIVTTASSERGQRHRWLWLTKRPSRMAEFSEWLKGRDIDWPSNLWAGTSITTQATTNRIKGLLDVGDDSTTRFLSVEPQIEAVNIGEWLPSLDWIIQGGESGADARAFDMNWATELGSQCKAAGVPYFLKQLGAVVRDDGEPIKLKDSHGGDWNEWPEVLRVRNCPSVAMQVV